MEGMNDRPIPMATASRIQRERSRSIHDQGTTGGGGELDTPPGEAGRGEGVRPHPGNPRWWGRQTPPREKPSGGQGWGWGGADWPILSFMKITREGTRNSSIREFPDHDILASTLACGCGRFSGCSSSSNGRKFCRRKKMR